MTLGPFPSLETPGTPTLSLDGEGRTLGDETKVWSRP